MSHLSTAFTVGALYAQNEFQNLLEKTALTLGGKPLGNSSSNFQFVNKGAPPPSPDSLAFHEAQQTRIPPPQNQSSGGLGGGGGNARVQQVSPLRSVLTGPAERAGYNLPGMSYTPNPKGDPSVRNAREAYGRAAPPPAPQGMTFADQNRSPSYYEYGRGPQRTATPQSSMDPMARLNPASGMPLSPSEIAGPMPSTPQARPRPRPRPRPQPALNTIAPRPTTTAAGDISSIIGNSTRQLAARGAPSQGAVAFQPRTPSWAT